ncbi:hypothetical protein B0H17DRAFT_1197518 [Mycena rosella]|uniref:Uncharacterized protein n=1 Tax=Mycena rosella TaxID=1033263 RepID=A0AAD7DSS6_MYCRO|nr:hypothetical protein B0H17DRAFT_1197518 [Mycena rosella]
MTSPVTSPNLCRALVLYIPPIMTSTQTYLNSTPVARAYLPGECAEIFWPQSTALAQMPAGQCHIITGNSASLDAHATVSARAAFYRAVFRAEYPNYANRLDLERCADHSNDELLDFGTQILGMLWLEDNAEPLQVILYPQEDLRVRLSVHNIALGAAGFEKGLKGIQVYVRDPLRNGGQGGWLDCNWETPLRVRAPGDAILLSYSDVQFLKDFDIHEPHLTYD